MKKTKINLIINRADYQKYEDIFNTLKITVFGLLGLFFVIFIILLTVINNNTKKYDNLNLQKKLLLQSLNEKRGDEAKIFYIQKKYDDMIKFLKNDAFSSTYYTLLTSALKDSSQEATLKSFDIKKTRDVSFTIAFQNFDKMMNFFKLTETEEFLSNFEQISLKTFTVIGSDDKTKENYELSFVGRFVIINPDFSQ